MTLPTGTGGMTTMGTGGMTTMGTGGMGTGGMSTDGGMKDAHDEPDSTLVDLDGSPDSPHPHDGGDADIS